APTIEDSTDATAAQTQAQPALRRSGLTPSTSDLENGLNIDDSDAGSKPTSQQQQQQQHAHVIDLSLPQEAMPPVETADLGSQKAKTKVVDPETTASIVILDSLGNRHQSTFGLLRGFMKAEANFRHGRDIVAEEVVGKYAKVPLQDNLCDCGVFLLYYIESFLKDPSMFLELALNSADMRGWFDPLLMRQKRSSMLNLAIKLADEYTQLQTNKVDAKDLAKDSDQQAAKGASEETSDQISDSPHPPAPDIATNDEPSEIELPHLGDDTE
ncbi:hypothetical protein IWW38_005791, partial [Coemansia aciculifera]